MSSTNIIPGDTTVNPDSELAAVLGAERSEDKKSAANVLLNLVPESALWHSTDRQGFVDLAGEAVPIRDGQFAHFLRTKFAEQEGHLPPKTALELALSHLEGKAIFDSPEHLVWRRVAWGDAGDVWLDLGDKRAVHITADCWEVRGDTPVRFLRSAPLPAPERGGNLADLRPLLRMSEGDFILAMAWLVGTLRPRGPFPVMYLSGPPGAGKSVAARILRSVVDPTCANVEQESVASSPADVMDLAAMAQNRRVLAIDNLSHLEGWLSDALCRISTGGTLEFRTRYTNNDLTAISACLPCILTGTNPAAPGREDLADRTITVTLTPGANRTEAVIIRDFLDLRPRVLGALLDAVSEGLKNWGTTTLEDPPRMADFAHWVSAAEPALPWASGRFLTAYGEKREAQAANVLEDPLAQALLDDTGGEAKSAGEWLDVLRRENTDCKWLPRNARSLAGKISQLTPALMTAGVAVERGTNTRKKTATYRFVKEAVGRDATLDF